MIIAVVVALALVQGVDLDRPALRHPSGPAALGGGLDVLRRAPGATLAGWTRAPEDPRSRALVFLSVGAGPRRAARAALWIRGARLLVVGRALDGDAPQMLAADGPLADGARHHVAAVLDYAAGRLRLHVDGVRLAEGLARFGGRAAADTPVLMGAAGAVDDLRVYDRALTDDEVARLAGRPGLLAVPGERRTEP